MSRPSLSGTGATPHTSIRAPRAEIEAARAWAKADGMTLAAWTRLLWRHGLPELAPSVDDLIAMEQER